MLFGLLKMSAMAKPDPTKDPEFQKVIRHFLSTPHQPHASKSSPAKSRRRTKKKSKRRKASRD
jgi:hypothetical protein